MSEKGNNKENNLKKFDLQERFINYAVRIIKVSEQLPETKAGKHISSQILRSGTSPAANYGEAQSAESKADFIHKLKVALKELRETDVWLKIIVRTKLIQPSIKWSSLLQETDELISILFKSIDTVKKKMDR
ncbi:MAG: four helix bundle protein [Candidatus Tenebribacter mawsonii]|nr:four helix bundle protein [Candidatus Tenebribacter mawsonii]